MSRKKADKSVYANFGKRMTIALAGVKRIELAEKIGVVTETLRVWCLGKSIPDVPQLLSLSQYLAKSIDWLLGNEIQKTATIEEGGKKVKYLEELLDRVLEENRVLKEENSLLRSGVRMNGGGA